MATESVSRQVPKNLIRVIQLNVMVGDRQAQWIDTEWLSLSKAREMFDELTYREVWIG